jgi:ribosome-binding protein aMBF1 (putative translation factor)
MVQDDKVSAVALFPGSASSTTHLGVGRSLEVVQDGLLAGVVGSASAMEPETPQSAPQSSSGESSSRESKPEPSSAERATAERKAPEHEQGPLGSKSEIPKSPNKANNVRKIRIERMMSKAELARRANLSVLTIDRVERGYGCRVDTKRKILEALGLSLADRVRVFGEEE